MVEVWPRQKITRAHTLQTIEKDISPSFSQLSFSTNQYFEVGTGPFLQGSDPSWKWLGPSTKTRNPRVLFHAPTETGVCSHVGAPTQSVSDTGLMFRILGAKVYLSSLSLLFKLHEQQSSTCVTSAGYLNSSTRQGQNIAGFCMFTVQLFDAHD